LYNPFRVCRKMVVLAAVAFRGVRGRFPGVREYATPCVV